MSETVEGLSLSLKSIHHIQCSDSLTTGVLSVGDRVTNDVLEVDLKDTSGLFVDETRDTLNTSTTSQTTNGWLGDTLLGTNKSWNHEVSGFEAKK